MRPHAAAAGRCEHTTGHVRPLTAGLRARTPTTTTSGSTTGGSETSLPWYRRLAPKRNANLFFVSLFYPKVQRDRNHPSIVLWSIGNEIPMRFSNQGNRLCTAFVPPLYRYGMRHAPSARLLTRTCPPNQVSISPTPSRRLFAPWTPSTSTGAFSRAVAR